jgi:hypothetical protein
MESILKNGLSLFRGIVRSDSKPIGSISLTDYARFTPAPDVSFTYQELDQISAFLRQTDKANDGTNS